MRNKNKITWREKLLNYFCVLRRIIRISSTNKLRKNKLYFLMVAVIYACFLIFDDIEVVSYYKFTQDKSGAVELVEFYPS